MKFSIIIPLYNKALYVRKAIESVLSQSYQDWELIVVDDGSKDDSFKVASNIISNCDKARIVRQDNAGVSTARNNGVALSKGEYVCFLDADDWWATTFLEEMDRLITQYPDAGIYGTGYTIVNETKNKTRVAPIAFSDGFEHGYVNYVGMYSQHLCMPLTSISVAIRRLVFDEMNGFKSQLRLGEDFDLWLRIALRYKVAMTSQPLAYYNQDVDLQGRAVGKLHAPETTEYIYYDEYIQQDNCVKTLLDKKRVYGLEKYYLSKAYHAWAKEELAKVDWSKQSLHYQRFYKLPICLLRFRSRLLVIGSNLKKLFNQS